MDYIGKTGRRGPNLNLSVIRDIEAHSGDPIQLRKDTETIHFLGRSSTQLATEIGIGMRQDCPMNFHRWDDVPREVKDQMIERIRVS